MACNTFSSPSMCTLNCTSANQPPTIPRHLPSHDETPPNNRFHPAVISGVPLQPIRAAGCQSACIRMHGRRELTAGPAAQVVLAVEKHTHQEPAVLPARADNERASTTTQAPTISIAGRGKIIFPPRARNALSRWRMFSRKCHGRTSR